MPDLAIASPAAPPFDPGAALTALRQKPAAPKPDPVAAALPSAAPPATSDDALRAAREAMDEFHKPAPEPRQSDPAEAWGSAAMAVAALGGLLTHTPLTTAFNAMGGVLNAYKQNDQAKVQQEFERWKVAHEAAGKLADMELKAVAEINKINDPRRKLAEANAIGAAYKIKWMEDAAAKGDLETLGYLVTGHERSVNAMKAQQLLQDPTNKNTPYWSVLGKDGSVRNIGMDSQPYTPGGATKVGTGEPESKAARADRSEEEKERHNQAMEALANDRTISTQDRFQRMQSERERHNKVTETRSESSTAERERHNQAMEVIANDKGASAQDRFDRMQKERERHNRVTEAKEGSSAAIQTHVEDDLKKLHPDWSPGQVSQEAKQQIAGGTAQATAHARLRAQAEEPPFTPEQAHTLAMASLVTGQQMVSARLGAGALKQVLAEEANIVQGSGHTIQEYLSGQAQFKADAASLRALTIRTDALDAAAKATRDEFTKVVIPAIPKTPEPLDMQLLTRWARKGETQFGDTKVPVYMATLISGLDEYAKVLAGATGAAGSTDASRAQAMSIIPEGATTDQIIAIINNAIVPTIEIKIQDYQAQKDAITTRMANAGPAGGGGAKPAAQGAATLPPAARAQLQKGHNTTFGNGQVWTLRNGEPVQVK